MTRTLRETRKLQARVRRIGGQVERAPEGEALAVATLT